MSTGTEYTQFYDTKGFNLGNPSIDNHTVDMVPSGSGFSASINKFNFGVSDSYKTTIGNKERPLRTYEMVDKGMNIESVVKEFAAEFERAYEEAERGLLDRNLATKQQVSNRVSLEDFLKRNESKPAVRDSARRYYNTMKKYEERVDTLGEAEFERALKEAHKGLIDNKIVTINVIGTRIDLENFLISNKTNPSVYKYGRRYFDAIDKYKDEIEKHKLATVDDLKNAYAWKIIPPDYEDKRFARDRSINEEKKARSPFVRAMLGALVMATLSAQLYIDAARYGIPIVGVKPASSANIIYPFLRYQERNQDTMGSNEGVAAGPSPLEKSRLNFDKMRSIIRSNMNVRNEDSNEVVKEKVQFYLGESVKDNPNYFYPEFTLKNVKDGKIKLIDGSEFYIKSVNESGVIPTPETLKELLTWEFRNVIVKEADGKDKDRVSSQLSLVYYITIQNYPNVISNSVNLALGVSKVKSTGIVDLSLSPGVEEKYQENLNKAIEELKAMSLEQLTEYLRK